MKKEKLCPLCGTELEITFCCPICGTKGHEFCPNCAWNGILK